VHRRSNMKEEAQKRCKMFGRDTAQRGERNKGTKQVVLYLLQPFCGLHPKQGCGRVACKDLKTKRYKGSVRDVVAHGCRGNGD